MARGHLRYIVKDRAGNVIQNAAVDVFQIGTETPVNTAGMFTTRTGGTNATNPLISNPQGEVEAWLTSAQSVDVRVTDNDNEAYYPDSTTELLTWTSYTESMEVFPAPEDIGVSSPPDAADVPFTPAGTIAATDVQAAIEEVASEAGGGAPTEADYLVGTAHAGLSAEIVVGTAPGGELGGTWAAPTVDASHSGSTHAAVQAAAEATGAAALSSHEADTTSVHGIADTSALETTTGAQTKVDTHVNDAAGAHASSAVSHDGGTVEEALSELGSTAVLFASHGAVGDGVADDTAEINAAIAALPAAGGTLIGRGTYKVTGDIRIPSNSIVQGPMKFVLATGADDNVLVLDDVSNVVLQDIEIDGNADNQTEDYISGISLGGCSQIVMRNIKAYECRGYNVTIGGTHDGSVVQAKIGNNTYIKVYDSDFGAAGDDSVEVSGPGNRYVTFVNCDAHDAGTVAGHASIYSSGFEVDDGPLDVTFIACNSYNNSNAGFEVHAHAGETTPERITYIDCRAWDIGSDNLQAGFRSHDAGVTPAARQVRLVNCDAWDCGRGHNYVGLVEGLQVFGGRIVDCTSGVVISDALVEAFYSGLEIEGADAAHGKYSSSGDGVNIIGDCQVTFRDCYIHDHARNGIRSEAAATLRVLGGEVKNNGQGNAAGANATGVVVDDGDVEIIGLRAWDDQGTETQSHGVGSMATFSGTRFIVRDSNLRGNGTAAIVNPSLLTGIENVEGHATMKTGRYYMTPSTSSTTAVPSNNSIRGVPIDIDSDCTLDRIGIEVVTTPASAGGTGRLCIYTSDQYGDGVKLLLDAGTVDVTTTGTKEITISQAVKKGRIWGVYINQGGASTPATVRAIASATVYIPYTTAPTTSANPGGLFYTETASGAAPATLSVSNTSAAAPRVYVRAS